MSEYDLIIPLGFDKLGLVEQLRWWGRRFRTPTRLVETLLEAATEIQLAHGQHPIEPGTVLFRKPL